MLVHAEHVIGCPLSVVFGTTHDIMPRQDVITFLRATLNLLLSKILVLVFVCFTNRSGNELVYLSLLKFFNGRLCLL